MSKYHSTLSRRDFMKVLGIGGVAALAAPVFRDLDEVMASPQAEWKRPSWVKEVDKPSCEIDWSIMKRFNCADIMWENGSKKAWGQEKYDWLTKLGNENKVRWIKEGKPGYTLRDFALNQANHYAPYTFIGPQTSPAPEELGVPRWEGTPEENARMVRAFLRLHGADQVTFVELDTQTTEKLIYSYDTARAGNPRIDILDVDQPEDHPEEGYRVLPKKARWAIVYTLRISPELIRRLPNFLANRSSWYMYNLHTLIQGQLQNFLRTLGYMCLGETAYTNSLAIAPGLAVMGGLGEISRTQHVITPEWGLMVRIFKAITDLPLAPGKPVQFGVIEFCKKCKKCAEYCPANAIPMDTEPSWETKGFYQHEGLKTWYRIEPRCWAYITEIGVDCGLCFAVCPFSKIGTTSYQDVIRSISSNTTVFNRAFRKMDDYLGYDLRDGEDIEKFWELDLPPFGWVNNTRGHDSI
nr:reductive dehalogenase [uncultured bacterium]